MATAPLDTVEQALNLARVRLLDAIAALTGDILTDTAPFTLIYLNGAWRRFQELLVNYGVTWFKLEQILPGLPAVIGGDPAAQVVINWISTPIALPQDLISPLILWERATGLNGSFYPMDRLDNGLPAVPKGTFNKSWEWRNGAIYMPGATQETDIRVRYAASYGDFLPPTGTGGQPFANQPIPILRAMNPLAWLICSEFSKARGDVDTESFEIAAQKSLRQIFDLDYMQGRSLFNEAELGKMKDKFSATEGPTGQRGIPQVKE
jgi:hypothetical protein